MPGFARGRKLDKIGSRAADTSELFFDDVRVPATNVLGELGRGFYNLMRNLPTERLGIAVHGVARARKAFDVTLEYVQDPRGVRHADRLASRPTGSRSPR